VSMVLSRIEKVATELKADGQELSPTLIMYEFCNQTMDEELVMWGSDIVDVAEKVEYYLTLGVRS
jgi:hypothetical protein